MRGRRRARWPRLPQPQALEGVAEVVERPGRVAQRSRCPAAVSRRTVSRPSAADARRRRPPGADDRPHRSRQRRSQLWTPIPIVVAASPTARPPTARPRSIQPSASPPPHSSRVDAGVEQGRRGRLGRPARATARSTSPALSDSAARQTSRNSRSTSPRSVSERSIGRYARRPRACASPAPRP